MGKKSTINDQQHDKAYLHPCTAERCSDEWHICCHPPKKDIFCGGLPVDTHENGLVTFKYVTVSWKGA